MSADTGTSSAATIRAVTAAARFAPRPAPSGTPRDQATPALVVAIAFAPAPAIATAEATSHAFGSSSGSPRLCRSAKACAWFLVMTTTLASRAPASWPDPDKPDRDVEDGGPPRSRAPLLRATMPGNLSLVIGSFWLGCWGLPGYGDGGNGDPEEFQAEEDALVEAVGGVVVLEGGAEQQVGDGAGHRDGEQAGRGGPPGGVGHQAGGYQDGADRDSGKRDLSQDQMNDTAAVLRLTLEVVGEEREQAGADRPGDEQGQAAAGPAVRADDPVQGSGDGQGQDAAQQEVQVHHPVPRAA